MSDASYKRPAAYRTDKWVHDCDSGLQVTLAGSERGIDDDNWEIEANGAAPSFQEFLAAEPLERHRFLDQYMASRGVAPIATNRAALASFLDRVGNAGGPAKAERALDALIRVRPERLVRAPLREVR